MRYAPAVLFGTALLSLAAGADAARADSIQWYYSWSRSPAVIYADGSTTSYVALSTASQTKTLGTAAIQATNAFTYGGGVGGPPAIFSPSPATQFTLTLNIWDPAAPQPGHVSFAGELFGYLTSTTSHIQSYYPGVTTKSLTLGKHLYTVHLDAFAPSGPDCHTAQVTAIATVTVQKLPEPTAAFLAALALPAAGAFWLRRRRQRIFTEAPGPGISRVQQSP
jgi:hypothetical protein